MRHLNEGRDTLVVMPTGYGKSAIYRIAARMLPGPTVVVSPLIALQKDQVEAIGHEERSGAAQANSTMSVTQREAVFADLRAERAEFLFLAPEQLAKPAVVRELQEVEPSLFVVDEAHCISAWGHDFRPDYLRLGAVAEELGRPVILGLTATASPPVRDEIIARLRMRSPSVVVTGFDRPNIHLSVTRFRDERMKEDSLLEQIEAAMKPGIVYTATRRKAEELAALIGKRGYRTASYHGGMNASDRTGIQARFMDDRLDVVVATTAFGMGIDKPNVRFVFHHSIPDSLDSYYQEIGRAGRDGGPADAALFYRSEDLGLRRFFAAGGQLEVEDLERVLEVVDRDDEPVDVPSLKEEVDLSDSKLRTALVYLEEAHAVKLVPEGVVGRNVPDKTGKAEEAAREAEMKDQVENSRVDLMRSYAESHHCRRQFLLNYFGETAEEFCGNCDNCDGAEPPTDDDAATVPYDLNSKVVHATWGEGLVVRYEDDRMTVLFDDVGYKTLSVPAVVERDLLQPVDVQTN